TAGTLMGAKVMHHFGYKDGQLTNQTMIEASQRIIEHITPIIQAASDDTIIEFLSNDLNGITGHIDHIIAARIACHVFYTLKHDDARLERIRLSCLPFQDAPESNIQWLYMEAGRTPDEITETVDARDLRPAITAIIRTHYTQRSDGEYHITQRGERLGVDHFIVKT
ncbi:MAG: hypothetical protein ABWX90_00165, partial [Candidatus Saccharimonadales bacterium]